jgi:hypothetical protein
MDARDGAVMGRVYTGSMRAYVHNCTQALMSFSKPLDSSATQIGRIRLRTQTEAAYTLT